MRTLVISDIHANSLALNAVIEKTKGQVEAVWCLGDVVGYGPNPNECIDLLQQQDNLTCLLGNHDAAAAKEMDTSKFNHEARLSVNWTKQTLSKDSLEFLKSLPHTQVQGGVTLSHGSPRQPVFEYLFDTKTAEQNFQHFETAFCFVGHTHLPVHFYQADGAASTVMNVPLEGQCLNLEARAILNPGSVGQPRDRDPRASFAIFDTEKLTWDYQRVPYDIQETQNRMKALMLPERHIFRLSNGW